MGGEKATIVLDAIEAFDERQAEVAKHANQRNGKAKDYPGPPLTVWSKYGKVIKNRMAAGFDDAGKAKG